MNKRTIYILIAVIVVLAISIIIASKMGPKIEDSRIRDLDIQKQQENLDQEEEIIEPEEIKMEEAPLGEFNVKDPESTTALNIKEVPETAIHLKLSTSGFSPKEFTVNANENISLVVTSKDTTHLIKFDNPILENIALGVSRKETRGVSFKVPAVKGDYIFYCDSAGHREAGEWGVMHVK